MRFPKLGRMAVAVATALLLAAPVLAQTFTSPINVVTQNFSFTATGASPWMALNGQGVCTATFTSVGTGASLTVQGASDSPNAGTQTPVTVTGINTTGVIANPTVGASYGGAIVPQAITFIRLNMTALSSGTVAGSFSCSTASGLSAGGGGGSGGTVQVSPLPLPVAPTGGPYQITAASPIPNVAVNGTNTPVTLSTACGTPTTPTSCATTSYALFDLGQQGSSDYSYQVNTISGATLAFYSSNDGVNFYASNLTIAGTSPSALNFATSTTVAGKFGGIGGGSRYAAIVATVAPTSAITVIPYLGSHAASVAIHGSVPLTIANTAAPYVPNSVNPLGTPAPQNLDAQGNELVTIAAPNNSGTSSPLKTTNSITGGAGSTLGLLGVGLCSGATSAPYCAAVNANSQLAVSNPYAGTVNQALQVSSFQGFGCVSSAAPGTLVTGDFEPCFIDLAGNMFVDIGAPLPAGTAIVGQFGINQTTPGTTNQVNARLCDTTTTTTCSSAGGISSGTQGQNGINVRAVLQSIAGTAGFGYPVTADQTTGNNYTVPNVIDGGVYYTRIPTTTGTTCQAVETNTHGRVNRIWATGAAETVTISIFDEGATPTCAAADLIWSGTLPVSTTQPVVLNFPTTAGLAYILSGTLTSTVIITRN